MGVSVCRLFVSICVCVCVCVAYYAWGTVELVELFIT